MELHQSAPEVLYQSTAMVHFCAFSYVIHLLGIKRTSRVLCLYAAFVPDTFVRTVFNISVCGTMEYILHDCQHCSIPLKFGFCGAHPDKSPGQILWRLYPCYVLDTLCIKRAHPSVLLHVQNATCRNTIILLLQEIE